MKGPKLLTNQKSSVLRIMVAVLLTGIISGSLISTALGEENENTGKSMPTEETTALSEKTGEPLALETILDSSLSFTAPISRFIPVLGIEDKIQCKFEVISVEERTCKVAGNPIAGVCAIDASTVGEITIPKTVQYENETFTVVSIGAYAFGGSDSTKTSCKYVTRIDLPQTIATIGEYAFAYCTALSSLVLSDSLEEIDHHAFYYCSSLPQVLEFPASLRSIKGYAFCRCTGLKTVIFKGNAPAVEEYAFTGGGVAIKKVIYYGSPLQVTLNLFNSEYTSQPTFYYVVTFYKDKKSMELGTNVLGKGLIAGSTSYRNINPDINGTEAVYEGIVPEWPEGTNLWVYSEKADFNYNNSLKGPISAYPVYSTYRDLSTATITRNTGARYFSYTGLAINLGLAVRDSLGGLLIEGKEYTASYQRKNESGQWVGTDDIINPGEVKVIVSAIEGSRYVGSNSVSFTITFDKSSVFFSNVSSTAPDGTVSQVPCWFRVTGFSEGSYTLAVSKGNPDIVDGRNVRVYPRAISTEIKSAIDIPSHVEIFGYTFAVTAIDASAFGDDLDPASSTYCLLSQVTIPKTVTSIGSKAFSRATNLDTVIFKGDADAISWGETIFKYATKISTVVWYGKKADNQYLFNAAAPTYSSDPDNYYTVNFYENKQAVGKDEPIGTATLREDVMLLKMHDAIDRDSGLYSGSIPDYPESIIDDGHWVAPTWNLSAVNRDNRVAWLSTLSDTVDVYAEKSNDAYTLDDAFIFGVTDGQAFDYTGQNVIDPANDLRVFSAIGREVRYGIDYTVTYQRQNQSTQNWEKTDNIIDDGNIRITITGAGSYTDSIYVTFKINAPSAVAGTLFTAPIGLLTPSGEATTVDCGFRVLSAEDKLVEVYRKETYTKAIDAATEGNIVIPRTVVFRGITYTVTTVSANSFTDCLYLRGFELPATVDSIGDSAFSGCKRLERVDIPETVLSLGKNTFASCSELKEAVIDTNCGNATSLFNDAVSLKTVTLGPRVLSIAPGMFNNCHSLETLNLPDTLTNIGVATGPSVFNGCTALPEEFTITKNVKSIGSKAFSGSPIKKIVFAEGTTEIAASLLLNQTDIIKITLPGSLISIGASAFVGTSITEITFPALTESIAMSAFGNCTKLTKVVFKGNPNDISIKTPFTLSRNIATVIYRDKALTTPGLVFTTSSPAYYSTVTFYENRESAFGGGVPIGQATVKLGTLYRQINEKSLPTISLLEGAIPDLPEGCNIWGFDKNLPLSNPLSDSVCAYGRSIDLTDLSNGHALLNEAFRYTGAPVDPAATGKVRIVNALGYDLTIGTDCIPSYQRRDDQDVWTDTSDLVSVGRVRLTVTALEGSGYTGSVSNTYVITDRMAGDTFVADDIYGNPITYKVLSIADDRVNGTVAVGEGGSSKQAVAPLTEGDVVIPVTVKDTGGQSLSYTPTKISSHAFYRRMLITSITIPQSVDSIGVQAFAYKPEKTDVQISLLSTVVFGCNLETTAIDETAFEGCNAIKNIIYGDRKGAFHAFGGSSGYVRWYTAKYYNDAADIGVTEPVAKVVAREGKYLYSLSSTDRWSGSDAEPNLPDQGMEWHYDGSALAANGSIADSMTVYAHYKDQRTFTDEVTHKTPTGQETAIEARFIKLVDGNGNYTGEVALGGAIDGEPAIPSTTEGSVVIPSEVEDAEGNTYTVTAVSAFALGASDTSDACDELGGIVLPSTVTSIGQGAFQGCFSLEHVTFGEGAALVSIGSSAFEQTSSLASLSLPETLTTIEASAFASSGLVRVHIPQAVSHLGKRAFTGCTELEEVVFGGAMALSLPAPESASDAWKAATKNSDTVSGNPDNMSGLTLLDDWTFANCPRLSRVVFDANVSALSVSDTAFQNNDAIQDVVFGDRRFTTAAFGPSVPRTWLTMSYFDNEAARNSLNRSASVVVREGTVYESRAVSEVLSGEEPVLETYYEWVYDTDIAAEMTDSAFAYARKISFAIDISAVDAAFKVVCTVDGKETATATYGDEVSISVTSSSAVQPDGFFITDKATGAVVLSRTDNSGVFGMPGSAVAVTVVPKLNLSVVSQDVFGNVREAGTVTLNEIEKLTSSHEPLEYSAWDIYREAHFIKTDVFLSVDNLLAYMGVTFDKGDSLVLYSGTNMVGTTTYNELHEQRYYYSGLAMGEYGGAVETPAVLAVKSSRSSADTPYPSSSYTDSYRLLFGQTEAQAMNKTNTYGALTGGITSITVIAGAEDLFGYTVGGVEESYAWTGAPIIPNPVVTAPDGTVLQYDRDYEVSYTGNIEAGIAEMTITGYGYYTGSISLNFKIQRAQGIAGKTAADTAAEIAFEGYPEGSSGAIIATDTGFADALSASSLGGMLDYPLLLTSPGTLPGATANAIDLLSKGKDDFKILVIGGKGAVSEAVENQLVSMVGNKSLVSRLGGMTQYDTSYLIYYYGTLAGSWSDTVVVASGKTFQDALSISPYAVKHACPLFLSDGASLTELYTDALVNDGFKKVVVVGGAGVISGSLYDSLASTVGPDNTMRLWGKTAYNTSEAIARWEISQGMSVNGAAVATGASYYDALAGSVLLGNDNSVLLLADSNDTTTYRVLSENKDTVCLLRFLGGNGALAPATRLSALEALGWDHALLNQ